MCNLANDVGFTFIVLKKSNARSVQIRMVCESKTVLTDSDVFLWLIYEFEGLFTAYQTAYPRMKSKSR